MHRPKSRTAGESVARQSKSRAEKSGGVHKLDVGRLERVSDGVAGGNKLFAVFPGPPGLPPHRCDITFLSRYSSLEPMFAQSVLAWGAPLRVRSRNTALGYLKRGFFAYLETLKDRTIKPEQVGEELLAAFHLYVMAKSGQKGDWTLETKGSVLGAVRSILGALEKGPYAKVANRISVRVPAGPSGARVDTPPPEVLSLDHLLRIMECAEKEVEAIHRRLDEGQRLLRTGRAMLDVNGAPSDYKSLPAVLAALARRYPGVIPDQSQIKKHDEALEVAVRFFGAARGGRIRLRDFLYPSPRDLVGIVLLLAVVTIFNPDTVLGLKTKNIDLDRDQAGVPAIQVIGEKARAIANLTRLLDPDAPIASSLTVRELFQLIIRFTKRIRKLAIPAHKGALLLYVPLIRAKRVKSYGNPTATTGGESSDETWKCGLAAFVSDHELEPFTLGQIRPTVLNLIHEADGSLDAPARAANHQVIQTTWTHYTSSRIRKNYRQRIGEVLLLRERWFNSKGRIDPRGRGPTENKGAATPGFLCLDPFDSPRPNQTKDRMCSAYGACPSCELAAARPNDAYSVACYVGLERAIRDSLTSMTAKSWRTRWAPVLADLKSLLNRVPASVLEEARNFGVKLPKVE